MELNKIYNEDCLIGMKEIPDKSIDMILCDMTNDEWQEFKSKTKTTSTYFV